jgi:hypothetical protein
MEYSYGSLWSSKCLFVNVSYCTVLTTYVVTCEGRVEVKVKW